MALVVAPCVLLGLGCATTPNAPRDPAAQTAAIPPGPPKAGEPAPDFVLQPYAAVPNSSVRLSDLRGKRVLLNFFCGCDPCHKLAATWEGAHRSSPKLAVLGVSTMGSGHVARFRKETGVTFPLLFDPGYTVAEKYDSIHCPRSWIIDLSGNVAYTNRPTQDDVSTVARALRQRLSDNSVKEER